MSDEKKKLKTAINTVKTMNERKNEEQKGKVIQKRKEELNEKRKVVDEKGGVAGDRE